MPEVRQVLKQITAKVPAIFLPFKVVKDYPAPERWNDGLGFVTVKLVCCCGSERFRVSTAYRMDGAEKILLSPVFVACEHCAQTELLFDASIHGWDGMVSPGEERVSASTANSFKPVAGTVIVNYSYQGIENYEELLDDGVPNPEDYFDTLSIYFIDPSDGVCEPIASFECA